MERILVIDDNSRDRKLLRDALAHEGYGVEEAYPPERHVDAPLGGG